MKLIHLEHKHGGRITDLNAIQHETHNRQVSWEFRGRVEWSDGTVSEDTHIAPFTLCINGDDSPAKAELDDVMALLSDYLVRNGKWTDTKWIPVVKNGSEHLAQ